MRWNEIGNHNKKTIFSANITNMMKNFIDKKMQTKI